MASFRFRACVAFALCLFLLVSAVAPGMAEPPPCDNYDKCYNACIQGHWAITCAAECYYCPPDFSKLRPGLQMGVKGEGGAAAGAPAPAHVGARGIEGAVGGIGVEEAAVRKQH